MRILRIGALLILLLPASSMLAQTPDRIDGIAAVVNGSVYTRSDLRVVRTLRLLPVPAVASDLVVVEALVERRVELEEAARYATPDPPSEAVSRRRDAWSAALPSGFDLAATLRAFGWTDDDLHAWLVEDVRIETYLDRLFSAASQPTAAEITAYAKQHEAQLIAAGAGPTPEALEAAARKQLTGLNRTARIQDWVDGLKRRASISIKIG